MTTLQPIEDKTRFSAADFHNYVKLNLDLYLPEAGLAPVEIPEE